MAMSGISHNFETSVAFHARRLIPVYKLRLFPELILLSYVILLASFYDKAMPSTKPHSQRETVSDEANQT